MDATFTVYLLCWGQENKNGAKLNRSIPGYKTKKATLILFFDNTRKTKPTQL